MSMTGAAARGEEITLEQRARLSGFVGLSLKNGLLNLVTLTLYRFWGKTEVRRRVWSSTYVNGEPLEYTGTGGELFKGFLFALLVLGAPFLLVSFGAQFLGPILALSILLPFYALMFFLFGFGQFTAFRYMASRTVWRGLRFELRGSAVSYGSTYLRYVLLSAVTLGWFWPAAARRLAAPLWGGLHFGDRALSFDLDAARRVKVYPAYALGWIGSMVAYLVIFGVFVGMAATRPADSDPSEPTLAMILGLYVLVLIAVLALAVLFAPYRAAQLRTVAAGVRLGTASFQLSLSWWEMAWLTLSNLALVLFSLGFLTPLVQARTTRFLVRRLSSAGAADLASIRQAPQGPRSAEGLADAFGMAPI